MYANTQNNSNALLVPVLTLQLTWLILLSSNVQRLQKLAVHNTLL